MLNKFCTFLEPKTLIILKKTWGELLWYIVYKSLFSLVIPVVKCEDARIQTENVFTGMKKKYLAYQHFRQEKVAEVFLAKTNSASCGINKSRKDRKGEVIKEIKWR